MRRKVIQIADSTQLISLPRKWALKYGIKKGDEVEVLEEGARLVVSTDRGEISENAELNIDNLEPMVLRYLVALYKKGVDEVNVTFNKPEKIRAVQSSIGKEAVGYEITDQTATSCTIKHVSGELEEFEPVLKRTFLLLVSMADQTYDALKDSHFEDLKNAAFLEEANNRFTTTCRRMLNKKGHKSKKKSGPLYYIIEDLENIADQYKYLCLHFYGKKDKKSIKFSKEVLDLFKQTNSVVKRFTELYNSYSVEKVVEIGKARKEMVPKAFELMEKSKNPNDTLLIHYSITIMQKIFCLVGPYLVNVL
jgi:phosphate uptake regulator